MNRLNTFAKDRVLSISDADLGLEFLLGKWTL
jgi:hypothetical protein